MYIKESPFHAWKGDSQTNKTHRVEIHIYIGRDYPQIAQRR